ncbi:MAG: hydrogenase iron-sulfur subunit [Deltaproteobacteria bacterium]|nr:hydrogenase iron-sulfur subunit [Deltaproteobacteria bacterium]
MHKIDARRAIDALIDHVGKGGRGSVLYQNMPVFGRRGQARYDEARLAGVQFIRVVAEPPVFCVEDGRIRVTALDEVLPERPLGLLVDRLVLPGSVRPAEGYTRLARIIAQPLDDEGFLQPSNVRHAPTATARKGVFFCGRCHEDTDDEGSELEAEALVSHVLGVLPAEGTIRLPEEVVTVDVARCVSCLTCLRLCPHGAIAMREQGMSHSVTISDTACFECGICAAACPRQAITHGGLTNEQLTAAANVAAEPFLGKPTLVVFACSQGAVQAADGAGRMGLELPAEAMIIDVPCAGRISEVHIMDALVAGAGGVVVLGCHAHNCRSLHGSDAAQHRTERTRASIETLGMDPDRVQFHSIAANEGARLAHILERAASAMNEE